MEQNIRNHPIAQSTQTFEQKLNATVAGTDIERSFFDKAVNRKDNERLHDMLSKENLSKEDIAEILDLLVNINMKLANLFQKDRILIGLFYCWVQDIAYIHEALLDWYNDVDLKKKAAEEKLNKYENTFNNFNLIKDAIDLKEDDELLKNKKLLDAEIESIKKRIVIFGETKTILNECRKTCGYTFKSVARIQHMLTNSTIGLGGKGFETLTKSKFEYLYPNIQTPGDLSEKRSILYWRNKT